MNNRAQNNKSVLSVVLPIILAMGGCQNAPTPTHVSQAILKNQTKSQSSQQSLVSGINTKQLDDGSQFSRVSTALEIAQSPVTANQLEQVNLSIDRANQAVIDATELLTKTQAALASAELQVTHSNELVTIANEQTASAAKSAESAKSASDSATAAANLAAARSAQTDAQSAAASAQAALAQSQADAANAMAAVATARAQAAAAQAAAASGNVATLTTKLDNLSSLAPLNVKDFGAVGDGSTDDAPAIQRAIDTAAQSNRVLNIPSGFYLIKSGLELRSNLHITGEGTILQDGLTAIALLRTTGMRMLNNSAGTALSNISLEGITFDGNRSAWESLVTSSNRGSASGGLRFFNVSGLALKSVKVKNTFETGVTISNSTNVLVTACEISDYFGAGLLLNACNSTRIISNVVQDGHETFGMYGRTASDGIFAYDLGNEINISSNTIINQTDVGIEIGFQSAGAASNVSVNGNTIKSRTDSQKVMSKLASSIGTTDTTLTLTSTAGFPNSGSIKVDNEIIAYTSYVGNTLTGLTRGTYYTSPISHAAGTAVPLAVFPSGIFLMGTVGAAVSGNVISGCLGDGIRADKGAKSLAISTNTIRDAYRGIRLSNERDLSSALDHITVSGNTVDARDHGIYIIGLSASGQSNHHDLSVQGNVLFKTVNIQGQAGIKVDGTPNLPVNGLQLSNNQISGFGYGILCKDLQNFSIHDNQLKDVARPVANWPNYSLNGIITAESASYGSIRSNDFFNCRAGAGEIKLNNTRALSVSDNLFSDSSAPATTLSSTLLSTGSYATIAVQDGTKLPTPSGRGLYIIIGKEVFEVAGKAGNTLTIQSGGRGFLGTTAAAHNIGDVVSLCSPIMFIDNDIGTMVGSSQSTGPFSRSIDFSDVGGTSSHIP